MSQPSPDLILYNAIVITLDPDRPRASWIAIGGDKIIGVGTGEPPTGMLNQTSRNIDCDGSTLVPGFNDAHCHVLSTAASLLALDCSPAAVSSIEEIKVKLQERSLQVPKGTWLWGNGYNEFYLREGRHLTRWDLDQVAPDHPVRFLHRSGHAMVLNSHALTLAGIHRDTPDPPDGVIERDEVTKEPTGLLFEMTDHIYGVIPPMSNDELERGIGKFNERCINMGITSIQDATPANNLERWELFVGLKKRRLLVPSMIFMPGARHLQQFSQEGFTFGYGENGLDVGPVKIMLTMTTGAMQPSREELRDLVRDASLKGFPVAIHAVEAEAVEEAVDAIHSCVDRSGIGELRNRIEHCSECSPSLIKQLVCNKVTVVTQPGFLYHSGERYLADVSADRLPWLYPIRSMNDAGIPLAAGSDSPVIPMDPITSIYAAVTRNAESGDTILPVESLSVENALAMHTLGGAYASSKEHVTGSIQGGKQADVVMLDRDPTAVDTEEIKDIRVMMTIAQGDVVWEL